MMVDKETADAPGILQLIATLSAQRVSGRLDLVAGATDGVIFFKDGKLLDARIGHLTGFQAMNAVASMRDARYHFDATAGIPRSSSITLSERLVLKQFFGIETVEPKDYASPAVVDEFEEATLVKSYVPSAPVFTSDVAPVLASDVTNAPVLTSDVADAPAEIVAPSRSRSAAPYLIAFAVSVLVVALAAAAVFLRSSFRQRALPASVATSREVTSANEAPASREAAPASEPVSLPVAAEPTMTERPLTASPQPGATVKQQPTAATASTVPKKPTTTAAADLTGNWKLVNTVHTTAHRGFQNLQIGFAVSINQTGRTFTAKGQKVSENGRTLPASSRTPIQLKGVIDGDRVEATFSEQGSQRHTNGRFVWKLDRAGRGLMGTFASTAAQSSGESTAKRQL